MTQNSLYQYSLMFQKIFSRFCVMDPGIETNKLIPPRPIVLDPIDRLFESRLKTDTEQRLS